MAFYPHIEINCFGNVPLKTNCAFGKFWVCLKKMQINKYKKINVVLLLYYIASITIHLTGNYNLKGMVMFIQLRPLQFSMHF